ncbi:uncharacterized protein LOC105204105 isoform X1 [Solenopsis invicta]|uniref:uncharacterized protein LOC105204105 isoform X1 n=1 Tax=Solenopsis invicta TaxID=13686 RepID=UPI00193D3245|nr:uncharacterized protein LOC105204105 isoform X1 [Solenopsis invicta]
MFSNFPPNDMPASHTPNVFLRNRRYPEKSSETDADEEFEGDIPTDIPTKESRIITSAGDDPRSVTLLKSLALKCECRSCNDKYASTVHTEQHTETESWSSPGIENAKKWKSMSHRKFVDTSSEDLDSSDYNVINYSNGKTNKKTNGPNLANHITKPSQIINHTKMKTYQTTNFTFFNVFFDIVFWPFVFLRAKQ